MDLNSVMPFIIIIFLVLVLVSVLFKAIKTAVIIAITLALFVFVFSGDAFEFNYNEIKDKAVNYMTQDPNELFNEDNQTIKGLQENQKSINKLFD